MVFLLILAALVASGFIMEYQARKIRKLKKELKKTI